MKRYLFVLLILAVLPLTFLYGQETLSVSKSGFRKEKSGFRDAWRCIKDGDKLFEAGVGLYTEAAECYLLAYDYNSDNAALNYKIAVSYMFGGQPLKSLDYFLKAWELDTAVTADILLLTGRAYHQRADYGKAIDCYNMYSDKYHDSESFNPLVNELIKQCNYAIEMSGRSAPAELFNAGSGINSEYDDYSPVISGEGRLLYFTTRRPAHEDNKRQSADMRWDENIFVSTRGADGWDPSGPAGDRLATELNEGVLYVAANGSLMYIYAGYENNGDVLVSEYKKGRWTKPGAFKPRINSRSRETSISLTADGNEMYFTSDRKKGKGGRDIYSIKRIIKNKWTKPFNPGEPLNSAANEESVYVSGMGDTLWFSSDRKGGMGGYDIYMSVKDKTGEWSEPLNIGMPANSQSNDMFFIPSPLNEDEYWLASDRPGGYGGFDIYHMVITVRPDTVVVNEEGSSLIIQKDTVPGKTAPAMNNFY
ncbi:MAG: hypothetical protein U5K32_12395 [Bacteroidales bacterium]|nr:hypothetical protein [Bacteroidales bacterium]